MFERSKNDIELLRASLNGSPKAFGVLVDRYQSLICAITYSATGSVERSEELAQEAFLRAWKSLGQLQDMSKFRVWLCRIARSTVQNWFRDRNRDVIGRAAPLDWAADKASDESGPEEAAMIQEQQAVVSQALAEIPESLREPLVLFYREQKSIREVAEQFSLTENAARQRISCGRSLLRKQVAHVVESTLARSRPGKAFTAAVVACIAGTVVKSSAAVAAVGAAHAAAAAGKSVGLVSLLSGATAKMAAVAAGLALVTGGLLAYRQLAKATEPAGRTFTMAVVSPELVAEDRPSTSVATRGAILDAIPVAENVPVSPATPAPAPVVGETLAARTRVRQDLAAQTAPKPFEFQPRGVLSGLVTDAQTGEPVRDALVQITMGRVYHARTDPNGFYSLETIPQAGNASVTVDSKEYVGVSRQDPSPVVIHLSPDRQTVQHFPLRRACLVDVRVVDAHGVGIKDAYVAAASLADQYGRAVSYFSDYRPTDPNGYVLLGGLPPSRSDYLVTAWHTVEIGVEKRGSISWTRTEYDYAPARAVVSLTDPNVVSQVQIVLARGPEVQGFVQYADGVPVQGVEVAATPVWWHSTHIGPTCKVDEKGMFTLKQIVPGAYNIDLYTPFGDSGSTSRTLMQTQLPPANDEPLILRLDRPSPQALVTISGTVVFRGEKKPGYLHIEAYPSSSGVPSARGDVKRKANGEIDDTFTVEGLEPGTYTLEFSGEDLEDVRVPNVTAPKSDLQVEMVYALRPKLTGTVVDARTGAAVKDVQVRARMLRPLRGNRYAQPSRWTHAANEQGSFSVDTVGPGIYQVQARADGYAPGWSEEINTDQTRQAVIALSVGGAVTGRVLDEKGRPLDRAKVIPLSSAGVRTGGAFLSEDGAVETVAGAFTLNHLPAGTETLKIVHPDHAPAVVEEIQVLEGQTTEGVVVALAEGGTVEGYVYDDRGVALAGEGIYVQDEPGDFGSEEEAARRLGTAVTDANGFYRVAHLPAQLCYLKRANAWKGVGVVRRAVVPQDARTTRLDFGGTPVVRGTVVIDGTPLAKSRIVLSSTDSARPGVQVCRAVTDERGGFVFPGVAPGAYVIYRDPSGMSGSLQNIATVHVSGANVDLGVIPRSSSKLVVTVSGAEASQPGEISGVLLMERGRVFTTVGSTDTPAQAGGPWILPEVEPGSYTLAVVRRDRLQWRKDVDLEADRRQWEVSLDVPNAKGRLSGHVNNGGTRQPLALWRESRDLLGTVWPGQDGVYSVENLPAGRYFVGDYSCFLYGAPPTTEFLLGESESKVLDLDLSEPSGKTAILVVHVADEFGRTPAGVRVWLAGPAGTVEPITAEAGLCFTVVSGGYTLHAQAPGYGGTQREVTLKPYDGEAGSPQRITVCLEPR
ncbi:MAG: sigma-70 family RNA polymerase sigma factor [Phycisphaerae bacterium]|nr:sigma-70 family RNA polymerase sigma factor [Phycisphaerae bacterium]